MRKTEFIELIQNDITSYGNLPMKLSDDDLSKLIDKEMTYLYREDRELQQEIHCILHHTQFQTPEFLSRRTIHFPDCIIGIYKFQEITGMGNAMLTGLADMALGSMGNFGGVAQFTGGNGGNLKFAAPWTTDILTYNTVRWSTFDLMKKFTLKEINYNFNLNTHNLIVTGRTPVRNVFVSAQATIPPEDAYNDPYVQMWISGTAKLHLSRVLGIFSTSLVGGTTINYNLLSEIGNQERESAKQYFKSINTPDYFLML